MRPAASAARCIWRWSCSRSPPASICCTSRSGRRPRRHRRDRRPHQGDQRARSRRCRRTSAAASCARLGVSGTKRSAGAAGCSDHRGGRRVRLRRRQLDRARGTGGHAAAAISPGCTRKSRPCTDTPEIQKQIAADGSEHPSGMRPGRVRQPIMDNEMAQVGEGREAGRHQGAVTRASPRERATTMALLRATQRLACGWPLIRCRTIRR